jgi:tetratricopeptide (TPR) repeat protein
VTIAVADLNTSFAEATSNTPPPSLELLITPPPTEADHSVTVESSSLRHARLLAEANPTSSIARCRLAQALLADGLTAAAVGEAKSAIELGAKCIDDSATVHAAIVLMSAGQVEEAERGLRKVKNPSARFLSALCAAHRREFQTALDRLNGVKTYEGLALTGWLHLRSHEYTRAIRAFREALEEGPATPDVLMNLGYAHAALGSQRHAIRTATGATVLSPMDVAASANLVAFRLAIGDSAGARSESRRIASERPFDLSAAILEAQVLRLTGSVKKGNSLLRSLRTDGRFWSASPVARADFTATLALLDRSEGRIKSSDLRRILTRELERSDYKARFTAQLLLWQYTRTSELTDIEHIIDRLSENQLRTDLHWAIAHRSMVVRDYTRALSENQEWARSEPFNLTAVSQVMCLLNDFKRDYSESIRVGMQFLRRCPNASMIWNNIAYAHALAGHLDEAREAISKAAPGSPYIAATQGLIAILGGSIADGERLYDDAAQEARSLNDEDLAALIIRRKFVALAEAGFTESQAGTPARTALAADDFRLSFIDQRLSSSSR